MRKTKSILLVLAFLICLADYSTVQSQGQRNNDGDQGQVQGPGPITLVVHGGAGTLTKQNMTREQEQAYKNKIAEAIDIGYSILENGGSALDAIIHTIVILENSPLFNAGKGAVFTHGAHGIANAREVAVHVYRTEGVHGPVDQQTGRRHMRHRLESRQRPWRPFWIALHDQAT